MAFDAANARPSQNTQASRPVNVFLALVAKTLCSSQNLDEARQRMYDRLTESPVTYFRLWHYFDAPTTKKGDTKADGLCGYRAFWQAVKRSRSCTGDPGLWDDVDLRTNDAKRTEFMEWLALRANAAEAKSLSETDPINSTIHSKAREVIKWIATNHHLSDPFLVSKSGLWFDSDEDPRTCWTAGENFPYLLFRYCDRTMLRGSTTHLPNDCCPCRGSNGGGIFAVTENSLTWAGLVENSSTSNYMFFDGEGRHFMLIDSTGESDGWQVEQALKDLVDGFLVGLVEEIQESLLRTASTQQVQAMLAVAVGTGDVRRGGQAGCTTM